MNCPEITVIIQNPDDSIQIATQPQLKDKKIIECYQCKTSLIFEGSAKYVQCYKCQTMQKVPDLSSCSSSVIIIELSFQCAGCGILLKSRTSVSAVSCPSCNTVTTLF